MDATAIKLLQDTAITAAIPVRNVAGVDHSTVDLRPVPLAVPEPLSVHTLAGLLDYIESGLEDAEAPLALHVVDPLRVRLVAPRRSGRGCLLAGAVYDRCSLTIVGRGVKVEEFILALQTQFVASDEVKRLLTIFSNITSENAEVLDDDGTTQTVTARAGVVLRKDVPVPNPVLLAPHRTFPEVEQPESLFALRVQPGPSVLLAEADNTAWKLEAIKRLADWLRNAMQARGIKLPVIA